MLGSIKIPLLVLALTPALAGFARAGCSVGDLDENYEVNFKDLHILAEQWLSDTKSPADLNDDGDVDMADFAVLAKNWHRRGAALVISEFMAVNGSKLPLGKGELLDEDGDSSDWIEIYNPTGAAVNLDGWYLTDDEDNKRKWEFPAAEIAPEGFLLVFASGKDHRDPESEMHTNFQLRGGGEFLALVYPGGEIVAHAYKYPQQFGDVSYGLACADDIGTTEVLVPEYTDARALIPGDASLGLSWTDINFDDSDWLKGRTGVGYDYGGLIGLDVAAMQYSNATVYIRIAFELSDVTNLEGLNLQMKYDDGFAAYINGQIVTSANAPEPHELAWNSIATAGHNDNESSNRHECAGNPRPKQR